MPSTGECSVDGSFEVVSAAGAARLTCFILAGLFLFLWFAAARMEPRASPWSRLVLAASMLSLTALSLYLGFHLRDTVLRVDAASQEVSIGRRDIWGRVSVDFSAHAAGLSRVVVVRRRDAEGTTSWNVGLGTTGDVHVFDHAWVGSKAKALQLRARVLSCMERAALKFPASALQAGELWCEGPMMAWDGPCKTVTPWGG